MEEKLILKEDVINSCHGELGDLPPWILREGIHHVVSPLTGTPDSARAEEIWNDR